MRLLTLLLTKVPTRLPQPAWLRRVGAAAGGAFALGVLGGVEGVVSLPVGLFVALIAIGASGIAGIVRTPRHAVAAMVVLTAWACGIVRGAEASRSYVEAQQRVPLYSVTVVGEVVRVERRARSQLLAVEVGEHHDRWRVMVAPWEEVGVGDTVIITGTPHLPPHTIETKQGVSIPYANLLARENLVAEVRYPHLQLREEGGGIRRWFDEVRRSLIARITNSVSEYGGMLAGMLLGEKSELGTLEDAFIRSGLIHLVVFSGSNIALALVPLLLFGKRLLPRFVITTVALVVAGALVLLSGADAPAVRAGIMGGVAAIAIAGRRSSPLAALVLALVGMAALWPLSFRYDSSLHLSFAAAAGVVLLGPSFEALMPVWVPAALRIVIASTGAAQLAVAPLLWEMVGRLSIVALPANVLVVPLVPVVMGGGMLMLIVGAVAPPLGTAVGVVLSPVLAWITAVARTLGSLPFAMVPLPALPPGGAVVLLVVGGMFWAMRRWRAQTVLQHVPS